MSRIAIRKSLRAKPRSAFLDRSLDRRTRLWILRILVPLQGHRKFIDKDCFRDDELAHALGLGAWVDMGEEDFDPKAILTILREQHQEAEQQRVEQVEDDGPLRHNLDRLAPLMGLTPAEQTILEFTALQANHSLLGDTMDFLGGALSPSRLYRVLGALLDHTATDIQAALSSKGRLIRSGLLAVSWSMGSKYDKSSFSFVSDRFAAALISQDAEPIELLEGVVSTPPAPELTLGDYAHVQPWLNTLIPYLRQVLAHRRHGVNVLLHGRPGTGKTQLSRLLSQILDASPFEVCLEDEDGDAIGGDERLRAYRTAQCVFARSFRPMLVFDEAEDVFAGAGRFLRSHLGTKTQISKAWINRLLEENPVPTLWISNSVSCIDPAYLRRFDLVIEVPVPSRRQRAELIESAVGDLLTPRAKARLSAIEQLPPALLTRAVDVVQLAQSDPAGVALHADADAGAGAVIERLIGGTLKACGQAALLRASAADLTDTYDPALSCADADLSSLVQGLARTGSARLCLYGPPGTGKTAWAQWLARSLDKPLLLRRASDLLSKWVGESEQLIAEAFESALQDDAILLIDEVDSFLQDRRDARQSWEITQVNEMLTQMEAFAGIFIASTNLMSNLDAAALRRFDLKVQFHYLKRDQARALYQRHSEAMGLSNPGESEWRVLDGLHMLTPGDFAVVARQHRFEPFEDHEGVLGALRAEVALKPGARQRGMGFV
ncbi:MAG: ATP-binding protein [Castellaniella sp.]|uniref:AAA family ATPase n=1 Tax=Castellaniella sp. TaxID=1955812 RepID=UPI003C77F4A5